MLCPRPSSWKSPRSTPTLRKKSPVRSLPSRKIPRTRSSRSLMRAMASSHTRESSEKRSLCLQTCLPRWSQRLGRELYFLPDLCLGARYTVEHLNASDEVLKQKLSCVLFFGARLYCPQYRHLKFRHYL